MVFIVINPEALSGSTDGSVKLWCLKDTTFRCSGISNCNVTASCWVDWVACDGRFFLGHLGRAWEHYGHTMAILWPLWESWDVPNLKRPATEVDSLAVDWPGKRHVESKCFAVIQQLSQLSQLSQLWQVLHWFAQRSGALLGLSFSGSESKWTVNHGIHGIHGIHGLQGPEFGDFGRNVTFTCNIYMWPYVTTIFKASLETSEGKHNLTHT